ncbi:hypothetical protein Droror1_Dr00011319 [Drosera rotundifolia]
MVVAEEFLFGSSIISIFVYFIKKAVSMATNFKIMSCLAPSSLSSVALFVVELCESIVLESPVSTNEPELCNNEEEMRDNVILQENDGFDSNVKIKLRIRPTMLVVPDCEPVMEFRRESIKMEDVELESEGRDHCLVSRKGRKETMEDRYKVIMDIQDDPRQAFFTVIDGHGGHAAAEYVADHLGKNIVEALKRVAEEDVHGVEQAIRDGYLVTDKEFLAQGVGSGACATSVLFKDGALHVANLGDCRVVLSRNGVADRLTNDHNLSWQEERSRVEDLGGYVDCHNGVWRVQGSLAVSRAIGDLNLKKWISSEPEVSQIQLTPDCEFLILASDGLWNKVDEQEAVDMIARDGFSIHSSKKLINASCGRGNKDDITVMVINLRNFVAI